MVRGGIGSEYENRRFAMTVQEEAIRMINSLPEDTVGILVEFLKRIKVNEKPFDDNQDAGAVRVQQRGRKLGIADGRYNIPDNIDACNDEIAQMFGVAE